MLLLGVFAVAGCFGKKPSEPVFPPISDATSPPGSTSGPNHKLIVTLENTLVGKVAMVNLSARFVVLNFPIGHMPAIEQHLNLWRHGLKVGEVKVTGPQQDDNIVADLVSGDAELGDDVRDR